MDYIRAKQQLPINTAVLIYFMICSVTEDYTELSKRVHRNVRRPEETDSEYVDRLFDNYAEY